MTQVQKIIKYVALAFAFFLIFSIISGIMGGVLSFVGIFGDNNISEKLEELKINDDATFLDIEVSSASIIIKSGDVLKAETNNEDITVKEKNNKLFIEEKKHNLFNNNGSTLVIYVPDNFTFDGVAIESGAGQISIDKLFTKNLDLDLGAGKVTIDNLNVTDETSIDGGAGKITILNSSLHNLDLDMGVGELSLSATVTGNSKVDAGVGKVDLNLIGSDYKIKVEKGIGSATINGSNVKNDTYYGEGNNIIDIDGGVGSISISYNN